MSEGDKDDYEREDPPRRMDTPASATSVTVEKLMRWAREGRLRIPDFQRPLGWDSKDKRNLLDSMERGYPVGTLLLWKRPVTAVLEGIALPGATTVPTTGDVYFVVDGQQRVATLWEALGPARSDRVQMYFDFATQKFQLRPASKGDRRVEELPALPLSLALDATNLSEWMPQGLDRDVKRRYFDVGKRLREYPLPLYLVEGDDVDVLREVFDRMNSSGRPLKREDVFHALVGSRISRGEVSGLETVNADFEALEFGKLDPSTIYKAFEAVRGERIGKSDAHDLTKADAEHALATTARALGEAIRFFIGIGVPHIAVLPYELPLVVLARFFATNASPSDRSQTLLRRWFWRGALGERLGGASSSLQQHVDAVGANESAAVQSLLGLTGGPAPFADLTDIAPRAFSAAHARGKLVICALLHAAPRDLRSGDKLRPSELLRAGLDGLLRPIAPPSTPSFGNAIANRLLGHPLGPKPVRLILECEDAGALTSHFITMEMRERLRMGEVDVFLSERDRRICAYVRSFFDTRTESERDDAPAVAALAAKRAS